MARHHPERSARYRRLRPPGRPPPVPSTTAVVQHFGSWNAALAAAGLPTRPSGGQPADQPGRRRARCIHGHKMDDANVLIDYRGKRRCRTCQNAHQKRSRARRQARARGLIVD